MARLQALPEPESPDVVDVALSMIDARAWGVRLRVVTLIRVEARTSADGWARVSYRDLAKRTGVQERWAQHVLRDMAETEWVLKRGERGVGTRPTAWRLNPRVDQWRGVPWVEPDRELRALRLQAAAVRGPSDALASGGDPLSAALYSAALRGSEGVLVPRYNAALGALVTRWVEGLARHNGGLSAALYNAALAAPFSPVSPPLRVVGAETAPPPMPDREEEESVELFLQAVEAKTGTTVDRPSRLVTRARQLVASHPLPTLLEAVTSAPSMLGPPRVIEKHVPAWLSGAFREPEAPGAPPPSPEARLSTLRRLVATHQENDLEVPESMLLELAQCENDVMATQGARP